MENMFQCRLEWAIVYYVFFNLYDKSVCNAYLSETLIYIDYEFIFISDKPTIIEQSNTTVNEGDRVILSRLIDSNPLSNVSWYNGSEYLITQFSVNNSTFIIEKALCTDTKNFTLVASNLVAKITALVELLVNCKYSICVFLIHSLSDQSIQCQSLFK